MKRCPYCAEEIQDDAIKCRHCGEMLHRHTTDTLDGAETLLDKSNISETNQKDSLDGKPTIVNSHVDEQKPSSFSSETQEKAGITSEEDFESRYEILSTIGAGGMGVVYKARDRKLGREVAIKRLKGQIDAAKRGIDRFLQEARAIATLNHRNIVTIYELGEDNAGPFIVMEYVQGQNIQDRIEKEGKIELPQALTITKEVGQALAYAHKRSIIHRDIKPSNIIITEDGTPKLLDFGLAQLGRESELSVTGYGMGTLAYMAPEQKRDAKHADHRADIYALAKTLYHMVTGEYPDAVDLDMVSTEIRPALKRSLKPKPEDRQFTVEEFLKELEQPGEFPVTAIPGTNQIGTCISCGASNPEDVRFCQTCGAGLFEKCPKCDKEDRVGVKHCGSCGINIARFKEAQDALEQAKKYLEEKKYSRAIKEAKRGLQTGYMKEDLSQIQKQAKALQRKISKLQKSIESLIEKEDYEKAQELLSEALELDPSLDDLKKTQKELPGCIVRRDMEKARKAFEDEESEIVLVTIGGVLELDPANKEALDLKQKVQQTIKSQITTLVGKGEYNQARQLISGSLHLCPSLDEIKSIEKELPKLIAERDTERAKKAFTDKELDVALNILENALKLNPKNEDALNLKNEIQQFIESRKKTCKRRIFAVILIVAVLIAGYIAVDVSIKKHKHNELVKKAHISLNKLDFKSARKFYKLALMSWSNGQAKKEIFHLDLFEKAKAKVESHQYKDAIVLLDTLEDYNHYLDSHEIKRLLSKAEEGDNQWNIANSYFTEIKKIVSTSDYKRTMKDCKTAISLSEKVAKQYPWFEAESVKDLKDQSIKQLLSTPVYVADFSIIHRDWFGRNMVKREPTKTRSFKFTDKHGKTHTVILSLRYIGTNMGNMDGAPEWSLTVDGRTVSMDMTGYGHWGASCVIRINPIICVFEGKNGIAKAYRTDYGIAKAYRSDYGHPRQIENIPYNMSSRPYRR